MAAGRRPPYHRKRQRQVPLVLRRIHRDSAMLPQLWFEVTPCSVAGRHRIETPAIGHGEATDAALA